MAAETPKNSNPSSDAPGASTATGVVAYPEVTLRDMRAALGAAPESRLGERVRYARNDLNLNIEALSRLTKEYDPLGNGLSPTSIARYESGESLPGVREFRILLESLDVPMAWLLYGDPTSPDEQTKLTDGERSVIVGLRAIAAQAQPDAATSTIDAANSYFRGQVRMDRLLKAKKPTPE
jgi:transcriptional regulator with XRE-family HTH domain